MAFRFANSVADRSGSACGMSNEAYLPPTFAIAWTPIRISGTSRMSKAMGNGKTTVRVGPSTTLPVHEYEGLDFRKACLHRPGPAAGHFNIDDGHATHDSWRLYVTSPSDQR